MSTPELDHATAPTDAPAQAATTPSVKFVGVLIALVVVVAVAVGIGILVSANWMGALVVAIVGAVLTGIGLILSTLVDFAPSGIRWFAPRNRTQWTAIAIGLVGFVVAMISVVQAARPEGL